MIDLYLLDTSAIIAYLEAEDGGIRVRELLGSEKTLLPFVVVLEVHYVTTRRKGSAGALERLTALKSLPSTWLHTVDEATLLAASWIQSGPPPLIADALVAGFAISQAAILVHKDPEFDAIGTELRQERLPYKPRRGTP